MDSLCLAIVLVVVLTASDVRMHENYVSKGIPETSYSPHCLAWPTCKFKIGDVYSKDLHVGEWKSLDLIIIPVIRHNFELSIS